MALGGFIAGAILFWLLYSIGTKRTDINFINDRTSAINRNKDRPFSLSFASVSTDLIPLLQHHLKAKDSLWTVGTGSYFLTMNKEVWKAGLKELFNKNIKVSYILIDPCEEALREILTFKESCLNLCDFWILQSQSLNSQEALLAKRLKNKHPTIAFSTNKEPVLMWIEGNHPDNSARAYNIEFTPPSGFDNERMLEFAEWFKQIELCQLEGASIVEPEPSPQEFRKAG